MSVNITIIERNTTENLDLYRTLLNENGRIEVVIQ